MRCVFVGLNTYVADADASDAEMFNGSLSTLQFMQEDEWVFLCRTRFGGPVDSKV